MVKPNMYRVARAQSHEATQTKMLLSIFLLLSKILPGTILTQYTAHDIVAGNLHLLSNNNLCSANKVCAKQLHENGPEVSILERSESKNNGSKWYEHSISL